MQSDHFRKGPQTLLPHLTETPRTVDADVPQADRTQLGELDVEEHPAGRRSEATVTSGGARHWAAPLHAAVLDGTGVGPGTSLLDLGCGPGLFARAAVARGARVTGIDADAAAVQRAAADVPQARFSVGDAEHPPPGPFDVVAAVQLLMHVADPVAVLAASARSGAVVAATVWGREFECDVRAFGEALAPWLGPSRPRPDGPPVTDPERLRELGERGGLVVERVEEVVCPFDYADEQELLGPLLESALGRAAGRRAGPAVLRSAVLRHLEPFRTATGGYRLHNLFRVLVARPAGSGPRHAP